MTTATLFPASVVGSMPRPQFVRDLVDLHEPGQALDAREQAQLDAAVVYVVKLQEAAGLDVVSDGEWRRRSYIGVIAQVMDGFELTWHGDQSWHTVVRPMTPRQPGFIAEEGRFVAAHTDRQVKVAMPSPYLLGQRMWDAEHSRDAYPTREAFMEALVPVLRGELIALRDAGVAIAQFDDPHICLFVDERVRAEFDDPDRECGLGVDLLNAIVDGVDGIQTALHLCRRNKGRAGWVGEGGYGPIIPHLKRLQVDQLLMEFTIPVAGDFAVLQELPERHTIGLGCVDCRGERVDTPEVIVERVERALKYLPPERISLNPDCGFAPGSAADIPLDEAYVKLRNEVQAAIILRERHG